MNDQDLAFMIAVSVIIVGSYLMLAYLLWLRRRG